MSVPTITDATNNELIITVSVTLSSTSSTTVADNDILSSSAATTPRHTVVIPSTRRNTWRSYLESLIISSTFLHRLGSALFFYHCLLLFTALSTITLYCLSYNPDPSTTSSLLLFLIFHAIKSFTSLLLLTLRACYPHLWHTQLRADQTWLSTSDTVTRQYHHVHLLCRVCFLAWIVLGTVWILQPEWEGRERPPMLQYVVGVILAVEYAVMAMHLLCFLPLLWLFGGCNQLSFALPFIPTVSPLSSSSLSTTTRRGLTKRQIAALPLSSYQAAEGGADDACAVCLSSLVDGELVRSLRCHHCFHQACIDEWLEWRAVCPLCVRTVAAVAKGSARRESGRLSESALEMSDISGAARGVSSIVAQ